MAMSAMLAQKADATHKIMDSHRQNMSLEAGRGNAKFGVLKMPKE